MAVVGGNSTPPGQPDYRTLDQSRWQALGESLGNIVSRLRKLEVVETANGARAVPVYTVAGLPTPAVSLVGWAAYASNGRKVGEGVGAGTGVLCYCDGVAWRTCDTSLTVAA